MPISTDKNTNYGPPLVNQKYAPLANIGVVNVDGPIYSGLLANRDVMLRGAGLLGRQLRLAVPNWANTIAAEAGHLPPLVVVSSNRAGWIRAGLDAGINLAATLNLPGGNFANVSDLRALQDWNGAGISPPLYAPNRIGVNRNVYVVVQMAEYRYYQATLAGIAGITPVGWEFVRPPGTQANLAMVGFGATRFAAMEFCKQLRQAAGAPWNAAWIIDDNTVALSNFAGFAAVEAALGVNACAGFRGGTLAVAQAGNKGWANTELAAGRGVQVGALPVSAPPGVIQQAVLWNINFFDVNRLNFGPVYISSAEDLSVANYFNSAPINYQFYNGIGIVKEHPTYDNRAGAQKVNQGRQALTAWIAAAESLNPPAGTPPPPVDITPQNQADGGNQNLAGFVTTRVVPNAAAVAAQAGNVNIQNLAKCQAVEQLTCAGLNAGFVAAAAIAGTFRINGANQQNVNRVNLP